MQELETLNIGDLVNVILPSWGTTIKGWRVVSQVRRYYITIDSNGIRDLIVHPREVLAIKRRVK